MGVSICTMLWRRLDVPGHDACRLERTANGWRLDGATAFRSEEGPACLAYEVNCDPSWQTQAGVVTGWLGARAVALRVMRTGKGLWSMNGRAVPQVAGCMDLDLGFTPATNLFQLRRVALRVGQGAEVPVAWLDVTGGTLELLHQSYERRIEEGFWYEAPRFGYAALLEVSPAGFVRRYPGLWEAEV